MKNPPTIQLDGFSLTIPEVIRIARKDSQGRYATVTIAHEALSKVRQCAEFIRKKAEDDREIIYGVTTGFGSKADTPIDIHDAKTLQRNLLISHACGVGPAFPVSIVRAMMVIRLNTLLQGHSGVQTKTVELLCDMINKELHPVVPSQGSVGASGDLCPLSHMALPLIGEGTVTIGDDPQVIPARTALKHASLQPIELGYKEGIALNNGTSLMTALGVFAVTDAMNVLKLAAVSSALAFEALCARSDAYRYEPIHTVRNHAGQIEIARWLTLLLSGSTFADLGMSDVLNNDSLRKLIGAFPVETTRKNVLDNLSEVIGAEPHRQKKFSAELYKCVPAEGPGSEWNGMLAFAEKKFKPQNAYSIRCTPQVFGASLTALRHVESIIANELNAAVDNPLVFLADLHPGIGVDEDRVVSGGNFHGEPIGMSLDYLKVAVAEIGNIVERQINKLLDHSLNDGLPSFLAHGSGLNSGLMIVQYAAASIVSENKVLVHPATADSIPTCENMEDHVSMAPIAGRQALEIIENVKRVVAIGLLTGYQAIALRKEQFQTCGISAGGKQPVLSAKTDRYYKFIETILHNKFNHGPDWLQKDRFLSPEIQELLNHYSPLHELADELLRS